MGLTSAMFTGLSGINAAQFRLDTIGDNIANINTTGFKGTRSLFETQFARTLNSGTGPGALSGGTNPSQLGLGATLGAVQRLFSPGSIQATGFPTDLAIEGNGFFVLRTALNEQVYTRDGAFTLSANNRLVSQTGYFVQGYAVNDQFQIIPGALRDLTIPVGTLTSAQATRNAQLSGSLNSNGNVGTAGTILQSQALVIDGAGTQLTSTATLLTDLRNQTAPATTLLNVGDTISINGIQRGGADIGKETFTVTATSTVADFLTFLDDNLGLDSSVGLPGNAGTGIVNGELQIRGNVGTANAITINPGTLVSSNAGAVNPFLFAEMQKADGESIRTTFIAYDSLGTPMNIDITAVLESKGTGSNTWRFYVSSPDDADTDIVLGNGTITFDSNGRFLSSTGTGLSLDRTGTGAATPMALNLDFSGVSGLTVRDSALVMDNQDGFATGTLIDFSIGSDGLINGTFSNGQSRTLGQIAMATFANDSGLVQRANSIFFAGPNSGTAQITAPLQLGAGRVLSGALELSNVDLSQEFVGLISAQTAFSASSRVISTSQQLLQELLLLGRQ